MRRMWAKWRMNTYGNGRMAVRSEQKNTRQTINEREREQGYRAASPGHVGEVTFLGTSRSELMRTEQHRVHRRVIRAYL